MESREWFSTTSTSTFEIGSPPPGTSTEAGGGEVGVVGGVLGGVLGGVARGVVAGVLGGVGSGVVGAVVCGVASGPPQAARAARSRPPAR